MKEQLDFFMDLDEGSKNRLDIFEALIDMEYAHPKGENIYQRFLKFEEIYEDDENYLELVSYFLMKEDLYLLRDNPVINKEAYIEFFRYFYMEDYDEVDISFFYKDHTPICLEIGDEYTVEKEMEEISDIINKVKLSPIEEENIKKLYQYIQKIHEDALLFFFFNGASYSCEYCPSIEDEELEQDFKEKFYYFMKCFLHYNGVLYLCYDTPMRENTKIVNGFEVYNRKFRTMSVKHLKENINYEIDNLFNDFNISYGKAFLKFALTN